MLYRRENPHGGDLYGRRTALDFSAGVNPLGAPPAARAAVARAAEVIERYPDPRCRELTAAIARYEGVPEEYILCGAGAAELIFSYCAAVRPRRALVPQPAFSEYGAALRAAGCEISAFFLPPEEEFALTGAFPEALRRSDADLVVLCHPNNPTGRLISPEILERTVELCREKGARLLVDECFLDLTAGGASLKECLPETPGLFLLKAFTKTFGLAGARLGYGLCSDGELLSAMSRAAQPWNISLPAQLAGAAALGETEWLDGARKLILEQREVLRAGLASLGFRVIPSDANFLLFWTETELKRSLLERNILIRDCSNFPGLGAGWYRAAVKLPEENRRLLAALEEIVHGA